MRAATAIAAIAFACVVVAVGYRAERHLEGPGVAPGEAWAMMDFRDAVYYPARALLDGNDPYDGAVYVRTYPVVNALAPYLPGELVVGVPFALLRFDVARVAYFAVTVLLMVALSVLTLRVCDVGVTVARSLALAAFLLVSRPGQMDALLGQLALVYVLAAYVALAWAPRRTWLAACGLAMCTAKPSFGLPLSACLLARDARVVVARGLVLGGAVSAAVATWIAYNAPRRGVMDLVADSYASFSTRPMNQASASLFRVDAAALAGRIVPGGVGKLGELAIGVTILVVAMLALRPRHASRRSDGMATERDPIAADLSRSVSHRDAAIACTATLLCVYHQAYDVLLVVWPAVALATGRWRVDATWRRAVLLAALLCPFVNYVATERTVNALHLASVSWVVAASLNALALAVAFVVSLIA